MPLALLWPALLLGVTYGFMPLALFWPAFFWRHLCDAGLRRRATYGLMPLALLWPALLLSVTYGFMPSALLGLHSCVATFVAQGYGVAS